MREFGRNILVVVLVLIMIYSATLTIWSLNKAGLAEEARSVTGKAYGQVDFCINTPPVIYNGTCLYLSNSTGFFFTINQDDDYNCTINATDADGNNVSFSSTLISANRSFFTSNESPIDVHPTGFTTFNTSNGNVGVYLLQLAADDETGCDNRIGTKQFYLTINNTNDPPYLIKNISDQTFYEGETIHVFYLNEYFGDPDLDPLTYVVSGNSNITVTIYGTSEVAISATACGLTEQVIFTAMDPDNETAYSNLVSITCVRRTTTPSTEGPSTTGSGGGGGGSSVICPDPEYECFEYHRCNVTNQKLMRCVDTKGCSLEKFITLPCKYEEITECEENWICSEWDVCTPEGQQKRVCKDLNNCGTNRTQPLEVQECEYLGTCDDEIMNCHDGSCEEGIDCGGPCPVCKSVQVPYPFQEERGIGMYLVTGSLMLLLAAILLYHYFKKEINQALAKFGWFISRNKRKQYLLSKEDQKKLLAEIIPLQAKLEKTESREQLFERLTKYSDLLRYYFSKVLKLKQDYEREDFDNSLVKGKAKIIPLLRKVFASMNDEYDKVSKDESLITKTKTMLLLEELRNIVLQTSEYTPGEYPREVQELKIKESGSQKEKMTTMMINAYIALEFIEAEAAKKKYLEIIEEYDKLSVAEEEAVFSDIQRLYNNVTYVNGWAWREKKS
ncbi:hypothetical protein JW826_02885 [Candidatus Woesearchaeota archaeon]|nr:hypothetical protein [Candidatus Woesearchaeota archaeon]